MRLGKRWMGLAVALLLALAAAPAWAQGKRVALVIGNAAYPDAPLRNPANDARAMAEQLKARGFEVILRENAGRIAMNDAVADFGEKLTEGSTALFFFAGHGIQVQGRNYLVPIDAKIGTEQRVRLETLDVEAVLDQMAAARARVSMVILDACRNNPFERRFRSTGGGLAQINAPEGTLIAYATAPGKVAADGSGANGLYTSELLKAMATPGRKVEDVFKQVRINVAKASNGAQVPWEASSLTGDFYFQTPAAPTARPAGAPSGQGDRELAFWESIKNSTNPREFEAYLQQFPNGTFAPLARARIDALQAARPAPARAAPSTVAAQVAAPPAASKPPVATPTAAPAARLAAEIPFRAPPVGTRLRFSTGTIDVAAIADRAVQMRTPSGKVFNWLALFAIFPADTGSTVDEPALKAIWPLRIGKTANYVVNRPNGSVGRHLVTVERAERIRVPAGEFDCLVVSNLLQSSTGYVELFTYWYAPAAGIWVKRTWELKAGTAPAQPPTELVELNAILRPAS